jgi:hypothetical protein
MGNSVPVPNQMGMAMEKTHPDYLMEIGIGWHFRWGAYIPVAIPIYKRANFEIKIPYIWGCAKMINSYIYSSEQCKLSRYQNLFNFVIFVKSGHMVYRF